MSETLELAKQLIARESVTPDDAGCQDLIAERLQKMGFSIHALPSGKVKNLWATWGDTKPLFVFAGHTDVVPTGPAGDWRFPPFNPTVDNGKLYGRGAADMKGSIAAMTTACERFLQSHPDINKTIGFLITSDEEGPAVDGTVKVIEYLQANHIHIDWCLVGEPSSTEKVGDVVKNGRRGSLGAELTVHGQQGHVAYPHLANNPVHAFAPVLKELVETQWDQGNDHFPPTTFQISNIYAGTGASNVIPGNLTVAFNLRFSTQVTVPELQKIIESILNKHKLDYTINWNLSGNPYITEAGELVEATRQAIKTVQGYETTLSTSGGTSDGRFIAPTGTQVIELGPSNATIHQIDEHVEIAELDQLSLIYEKLLQKLLA